MLAELVPVHSTRTTWLAEQVENRADGVSKFRRQMVLYPGAVLYISREQLPQSAS